MRNEKKGKEFLQERHERENALQTNQIEVLNLFILEKEKKNTDQNINTCKVFWNPEHKYL